MTDSNISSAYRAGSRVQLCLRIYHHCIIVQLCLRIYHCRQQNKHKRIDVNSPTASPWRKPHTAISSAIVHMLRNSSSGVELHASRPKFLSASTMPSANGTCTRGQQLSNQAESSWRKQQQRAADEKSSNEREQLRNPHTRERHQHWHTREQHQNRHQKSSRAAQ